MSNSIITPSRKELLDQKRKVIESYREKYVYYILTNQVDKHADLNTLDMPSEDTFKAKQFRAGEQAYNLLTAEEKPIPCRLYDAKKACLHTPERSRSDISSDPVYQILNEMYKYFDTQNHIEEINNNIEDKVNDEYNIRCDVLEGINRDSGNDIFGNNDRIRSEIESIADIFHGGSIKENLSLNDKSNKTKEYIKKEYGLTEEEILELYKSCKENRELEQNYNNTYLDDSTKSHRLGYIKKLITSMEHRKSENNQTLLMSEMLYEKLDIVTKSKTVSLDYIESRFEAIYNSLPISPELDPSNQEYTDSDMIEAISYHKLY